MIYSLKSKLKSFFQSDIRWKLIKLKKITKINLYPQYFHKNGFRGIYTKLIITLILREKLQRHKKSLINNFFLSNKTKHDRKINFLISTPSSGSNFMRLMLSSYFELIYQIGDGIPKYDNLNDLYIFPITQIEAGNLYNHLSFERVRNYENLKLAKDKNLDFDKNKIIFTRYPLENLDLFRLDEARPVILVRDPYEQILSSYTRTINFKKYLSRDVINHKLLNELVNRYYNFINFWLNHTKNLDENNYKIVKYENLLLDTVKTLKDVLNFYNYKINNEHIIKSTEIHKLGAKNFQNLKILNKIRFTDTQKKETQKKLINFELTKSINNKNLYELFNKLK